jgi:hypothetical protein
MEWVDNLEKEVEVGLPLFISIFPHRATVVKDIVRPGPSQIVHIITISLYIDYIYSFQ